MKKQWIVILLLIVLSVNVLAETESDRRRKRWLILSSVTLGAVYITTIVLDHTIDSSVNFPSFYVPVVGPYIALLTYNSKVSPYYSGRTRDILLIALSGAIQSAAAAGIALNLKKPRRNDLSDYPMSATVNFFVAPRMGGGGQVSCLLVF